MRVLIVEDDRDIRNVLTTVLTLEGFEVTEAGNGLEALEQLKAQSSLPDVVLLDIRMPVMDGLEFMEQLDRQAEFRNIPVITMSASDRRMAGKKARFHLNKPLEIEALLRAFQVTLAPKSSLSGLEVEAIAELSKSET